MAGSHRAPRGGSRAAAREARRQKARKRNQTIAAGVAVVVLVGGGGVAALNAFGGDNEPGSKAGTSDDKPTESSLLADAKVLLDGPTAKQLSATGTWAVTKTADGSSAPEQSFVCQSQRFADPAGQRTWVRTFQNSTTKDTAVQYIEVSNDPTAASKAYTTIVGWLSTCSTPQVRLTESYATTGVGDRGVIAVFGQPSGKKMKYRTISVTLAGQATMVLEHDSVSDTPPKPAPVLVASSTGLRRICADTGGCATGSPVAKESLLPTSEPAGFMAPVDLPVLSDITKPWVSTDAKTGAGTGCEKFDSLKKAKPLRYNSRTYLTPEAKVPTEFGLDETVSSFATNAAAGNFYTSIRKNVDTCEKNVSNAKVDSTGTVSSGLVKGKSWEAEYDTGGGKTFTFRIGIASAGNRVVYLVYPVLKDLDISDSAFNDTLVRAAERSATFK
ncbi:hypothetical protein EV646_11195 [Kribbella antiqua]|uniref:PknH-like protein n=1 Tax=Kribbella antiqua TaxID=2512217 RepID=A0A4R2IGM0_9ACTN|nr:hypothetical protein [Kribbella antiqua]TCO43903.1 hypothetical protein EV646_11195 [Kribbella antiqua]